MSWIELRHVLLWCTVINYGILTVWWISALTWSGLYDLCARLFRVPRDQVDKVNFAAIVFYKAAIILFNLVPLIALYIVNPGP